ncbi:phosphomevalonate kinase [Yamadazyma tenuis]|uniref:Phosphomevalonate kinase n=1 Tax=Candida tenuis (strain ATCC 10573 / BCRC 21748 / CBS 615 / JCM 9827 / NBRC 10315 / NRRL Y-1498 / VKM Y-70) TaxID=590646 RepID=G3B6D4_CANTC|nr:uncharacterized protein CANTEDRAFT_123710 [Yamadazyma tenuis ATCC 10573]EGV63439.1 hypothetical protein CANTEDRAFT_123710 [Yamadazyma tenuis ATCC 10573]WEJ96733.1 phosphomevalonate kinase [Yamadazyma tenuis]
MVSAFSSPGKALIAGGYLVLDPVYLSYVTALSARMHSVVRCNRDVAYRRISVSSPQFGGKWIYHIDQDITEINDNNNPFLAAAVEMAMKYTQPSHPFDVDITIFSDAGFHSQQETVVHGSTNGTKRFLYHQKPIADVAKTGLGSSACLTTVVMAAIMSQLGPASANNTNIIHNLAQIAHCRAQGKIGSGFDVATAVYGSIQYQRFVPGLIAPHVQGEAATGLVPLVDSEWDFTHNPCTLPPHVRLLMGDVAGGSETPRMVSKVLQWRKDHPEQSAKVYADLNTANRQFIAALSRLRDLSMSDLSSYMEGIDFFASHSVATLDDYLEDHPDRRIEEEVPYRYFYELMESIKMIREHMKSLTAYTGADIEPMSQTLLLDECRLLPGCFGGVVPGAGGYDAIALLVIDRAIDPIVEQTKNKREFAHVTWLGLHEEANGLVAENPRDYEGLPPSL